MERKRSGGSQQPQYIKNEHVTLSVKILWLLYWKSCYFDDLLFPKLFRLRVKSNVPFVGDVFDTVSLSFWTVVTRKATTLRENGPLSLPAPDEPSHQGQTPSWKSSSRLGGEHAFVDRTGSPEMLRVLEISSRLSREMDFLPTYVFPSSCNQGRSKKIC